jgi:preprotein translocase subunit YajC
VLSAADILAQEGDGGGGGLLFPIMIVGFIVLMYFVMIRPQRKRQREQQQMQSEVTDGARVMTIGGLYGTVVDSDDETVTLEASDDIFLVFARQAIARVLPTEDADDAEEAPLSEEEATLTDEDLERLRSSDDEGKKDDKKDK